MPTRGYYATSDSQYATTDASPPLVYSGLQTCLYLSAVAGVVGQVVHAGAAHLVHLQEVEKEAGEPNSGGYSIGQEL